MQYADDIIFIPGLHKFITETERNNIYLPLVLDVAKKIKPCPKCLKTSGLLLIADEMGGLVRLQCRDCKTESEKKHYPGSAVDDWNERIGYKG